MQGQVENGYLMTPSKRQISGCFKVMTQPGLEERMVLGGVAGILIAHSLRQDGPGLPCLDPAIFQYLISDNPRDCLPTKEDIPSIYPPMT